VNTANDNNNCGGCGTVVCVVICFLFTSLDCTDFRDSALLEHPVHLVDVYLYVLLHSNYVEHHV